MLIPAFMAHLFSYSGVGDDVRVAINLEDNACVIQSVNGKSQLESNIPSNTFDGRYNGDQCEADNCLNAKDDNNQDLSDVCLESDKDDSEDERIQRMFFANPAERDIAAYAKRSLIAMKNAGDLCMIEDGGLPREIAGIAAYLQDYSAVLPTLTKDWARRPVWREMYGARYIKKHEMSNRPNSYDLASEYEIRPEMSKLSRNKVRRAPSTIPMGVDRVANGEIDIDGVLNNNNYDTHVKSASTREPTRPPYSHYPENFVSHDQSIKSKDALAQLRNEFPLSDRDGAIPLQQNDKGPRCGVAGSAKSAISLDPTAQQRLDTD
ncbi:hypothetical protein ON010_g4265 [Phytophthora cinnamomi]|nr:hypothetical protein ON010_g4265 [Phytophthora cinnamomi]